MFNDCPRRSHGYLESLKTVATEYDDYRATSVRLNISRLLLYALIAVFASGCLADLRSASVVDHGVSEDQIRKGRTLLEKLAQTHGLEDWQNSHSARIIYSDTWTGLLNTVVGMPWPENGQRFEHTIILGADDSRLIFRGGPRDGLAWGIQNWRTYTVKPGGEPVFEQDDTLVFWLPTNAYFFEAPMRLREATVVAYEGEAEIDGRLYDQVFLSWGEAGPQDDIDQYVAFIERKSGRLGYLQYTIRDMMGFLVGTMEYRDYREVDGVWIAHEMRTVEAPGGEPNMHTYQIEKVEFDPDFPDGFVVPRPDLRAQK